MSEYGKEFDYIVEKAKTLAKPLRVAVAGADSENILKGTFMAEEAGFVRPVLIGNEEKVTAMLEKLGLYRDQVIMVGDSAFDIKCANNAEVESVMVGWSAIPEAPEEIGDYEADFYIEKPEELLDLLEDLNNFEDPSNYDRD